MKLYELEQRYYDWLAQAEENDGEVTDEMLADFWELNGDIEEQTEAVAVMIKNTRAEVAAFKAEKERLDNKIKSLNKREERLISLINNAMELLGKDKLTTTKAAISYRTSERTVITDETLIPEQYFKIEKKPILTDIKNAIKDGVEIQGAVIEVNKNIQVR